MSTYARKLLCDAQTVNGTPCQRYAMEGSTKCAAHLSIVGRKTILTVELRDELLRMLRAGNYIAVACRAVGITRQCLHKWLERGKSDDPKDAVFAELRELVAQARAEGEARNVALIGRAAAENWQAAAWLLERQYPERWGRTSVRLRDDVPLEADDVLDTPDDDVLREIDELAEARRRRLGA